MKMALAGFVLAAGGCRLGYDGLSSGDNDGSVGSVDADPNAPDAALPMSRVDVSVTGGGGEIGRPGAVWNGSEFALVWDDEGAGGIQFTTIGPDGSTVIAPTTVASGGELGSPVLVWTGSGYGLVWKSEVANTKQIFFATLDPNGSNLTGNVQLTNTGTDSDTPSLSYSAGSYCIAWQDGNSGSHDVLFNWVDSAGTKQTALDIQVSTAGDSTRPSIACNGSDFAITWQDDRAGSSHVFTRSYSAAVAQTAEIDLGSAADAVDDMAAVSGASGTAIVWGDGPAGSRELYYRHLNGQGSDTTGAVALTGGNAGQASSPSIASSGTNLALAWVDTRDGNAETYFSLIDEAGNKLMTDMRITDDTATSKDPRVTAGDSYYGIVWISGVGNENGSVELAILGP